MKDTFELFKLAVEELRNLFGDAYLKENLNNTTFSRGMASEDTYHFFVGFKTTDDLPDHEGNDHGWVSYAQFLLNAATGEIIERDYSKV